MDKIKNKFKSKFGELLYEYANELLSMLDDTEVLDLYEKNNKIFSTLSSMKKDEIVNDHDLLKLAINTLEAYLQNRGLSKYEYNKMDAEEIGLYIINLIGHEETYDLIKELENEP